MRTTRTYRIRLAVVVMAVAALAAGCSEDSSVGSGVEVGGGGGPGALRDQSTTTVAAGEQPAAAPTTKPQASAAIEAPAQGGRPDGGSTETTAPPPVVTEETAPPAPVTTQPARETAIKITDAGTSFDPVIAQAAAGTKVVWENTGTAPRQVADRDNKYFVSPMIEPGQKFTWNVNAPAGTTVNYRDTTRPYAQAAKIEIY